VKKTILITILGIFGLLNSSFAQTPYSTTRYDKFDDAAGGFGAYNPYMGIKINGFTSSNDLSQNYLINLTPVKDFEISDKFHLPVFGNIGLPTNINFANLDSIVNSLKEVFLSESGLQAGLYPYYIVKPKNGGSKSYFVIHGETSIKFNGFKDDQNEFEALRTIRFSAGFEYGIKLGERFLTTSITPTYVLLDEERTMELFDRNFSSIVGVELSTAIPLFKLWDTPIALGAEITYDNRQDFSFGLGILAPIEIKLRKAPTTSTEN